MPHFSGRTALRHLCVCALLAFPVTGAHAVAPVPVDDGAITLDQTIQAVKDETIQFNRDSLMAEEAFLYPPQTRLSVYVSNTLKNVLLTDFSLTLDDRQPVTYHYGDQDSRALLVDGALQRLLLTNVERGVHRLRVSYKGNYVAGDKKPIPVTGEFEATFTKDLEAAEVELQVFRGRNKSEPAMKLKEWRAAEE
ncbi:hypothetical protein DFR24_0077 [Panacagrimonas perspica]|uniref:AraC family transcriptional regulator n=1 Tax=Panacagrimonas perspica TaxID=381431 RepID=A0A4R7P9P8_9GAMM|nr:hypothetical protein DFR24_0077 [Panacagrimonas perspica]